MKEKNILKKVQLHEFLSSKIMVHDIIITDLGKINSALDSGWAVSRGLL